MIASAVAANVAAKVVEHALTGTRIDLAVRKKLSEARTKHVFASSIESAATSLKHKHPEWADALIEMTESSAKALSLISELLLRDGKPDPIALADAWLATLDPRRPTSKDVWLQELEHVATDFLASLQNALKAEPELTEINNGRNLEAQTDLLSRVAETLGAERATPGTQRDYLKWLRGQTLYLNEKGTPQATRNVEVELKDVYISLTAYQHRIDRDLFDLFVVHRSSLSPSSDDESSTHQFGHSESMSHAGDQIDPGYAPLSPIELHDAVRNYDRVVILGDPGSGKSTLTRYLALQHAEALSSGRSSLGELGPARFPILIRVAEFVDQGLQRGKSLSESLADICAFHECPSRGLRDLIEMQLAQGNCIVLLDGLDEVTSADDRRRAVTSIEDFIRRHSHKNNRFVVTSRPAGYRETSLAIPFQHFTMSEMTTDQIERFLSHWCLAVAKQQFAGASQNQQQRQAEEQISGILEAIDASLGVRRLASNPLLLRIITLVHGSVGHLPRKRVKLYELAAETFAKTWRVAQGVKESALAKDEYLIRLLPRLGYWLQQEKSTGIASRREVIHQLSSERASIFGYDWNPEEPHPDIEHEVRDFLEIIQQQTGIVVEKAPEHYGFMHLTFQEFYAAHQLIRRSRRSAHLIREKLHDPRWEEPILLALGLRAFQSPDDAIELFESAILASGHESDESEFEPSPHEDLLGRDFLFALRCIGDEIPSNPSTRNTLIYRLADELLHLAGSARFERYRRGLTSRVRSLRGTDMAREQLVPLLLEGLEGADTNVQLRAVKALEELRDTSPEVVNTLFNVVDSGDQAVRRDAAFALSILGDTSESAREALIIALDSDSIETRFAAAAALARGFVVTPSVVDTLLTVARSGTSEDRETASMLLGLVNGVSDEASNYVASILIDGPSELKVPTLVSIRLVARITGISETVKNAVLDILKNGPRDERWFVSNLASAVTSLEDDSQTILIDLIGSGDPQVVDSAAVALSNFETPRQGITERLVELLGEESSPTGLRIARTLVGFAKSDPAECEILADVLQNGPSGARSMILTSLVGGTLQGAINVQAALHMALESDRTLAEPIVRSQVLGDEESRSRVVSALMSMPSELVESNWIQLAFALARFGHDSPETREPLHKLVKEQSDDYRVSASLALASLGTSDDEVVHVLVDAAGSSDDTEIRVRSTEALGDLPATKPEVLSALVEQTRSDTEARVREVSADTLMLLAHQSSYAVDHLLATIPPMLKEIFEVPDEVKVATGKSGPDLLFDVLWRITEKRS